MKIFKYYITLILVALCAAKVSGQVLSITPVSASARQYAKIEFNIKLIADWQNPYLQNDIALDMLLRSPSGKEIVLPCYYESGMSGKPSLWKARFAPREAGKYTYGIRLRGLNTKESQSITHSFIVAPSKRSGFLHPNDNWTFKFDNGKRFRGIGENIGWESRTSDDSKFFSKLHQSPRYNYDYMLKSLAKHGGNFFRTWISRWNLPIDWHDNFNNSRYTASDKYFNPSAVKRMDRLVNLSDSLGVYMMLTLGMGAYEIKDGGFSPTAADFFVNPKSKERYKDRLRYIIARWGYSTNIAAWELFNEVDNVQFGDKDKPISADSIVAWHDEMSTYIKSIDPYRHMVTTSISHRDLKGLNTLRNIDFNQKHIYKNTAGIPKAITEYEALYKKPYVIGEYGYEWDWSKNFDDFAPHMDDDFKRGLWYGLFSPTPILPLSWWWEYFDNRGTDKYFSKIREVNNWIFKNNAPLKQSTVNTTMTDVYTTAIKCGREYFVYVYNAGNNGITGTVTLAAQLSSLSPGSVYEPEGEILEMLPPLKSVDGKTDIYVENLAAHTDRIFILR
ncbi:DUF5060 domain-containing protein [Mucilaginibacter ginkgonis]|uniref:DUF5060 domain-containing protein n=1 Tax=Mucilaginibacter ginkgonis TaxID=2682091 RepID=A0A6I4I0C1_9SPHI|nr:DUF5060 domain-containing protein [Mucilaginibacter ginkgonis]QQL50920.1 DUF5060 domain-containing protein [Mucilaginibacter ginkgonis]